MDRWNEIFYRLGDTERDRSRIEMREEWDDSYHEALFMLVLSPHDQIKLFIFYTFDHVSAIYKRTIAHIKQSHNIRTRMHTHTSTHAHIWAHTHTHARTHARTHTRTHTHAHTHTHTQAHTCTAHTHAHDAHMRTAHTHTHNTRARTHAHTHESMTIIRM